MILSMTGFGRAELVVENFIIKAEVRSLNSKQADIKLRTPHLIRDKEYDLRKIVQNALHRGKIDLAVEITKATTELPVTLDESLASAYLEIVNKLEEISGDTFESKAAQLLRMPEVLKSKEIEPDDSLWPEVEQCVNQALSKLTQFRADEGSELAADLTARVAEIQALQAEIESLQEERKQQVKQKLRAQLDEVFSQDKINEDRFEQELIYYLEKYDINEELVRLRSHCKYFLTVLNEEKNQGRKLGFITQEIGREVNTIGAKANFAAMQVNVVKMKDEVEKIKEQILNVL